ncbi:hypothetical protein GHJ49_00550 [Alistipes sp. dk3620]|uniref:hypothetical protein n=1 Tax=unclassified Alistipes TaxID=2608932 RepID=UPI0012967799|nr:MULTISPECIES: hypothetical protein [unclassified Alistipes]MQX26142.1 hypothetical protein [Alistipes sp. dk3620]QGA23582.1 hypothetical protein GFH31_06920 [Alistipes sp. dk3624]
MDSFIRLNRKFFTNVYWSQQRTFSLSEAWLDLIQMARFDAEPATKELPNGRLITIKRGEIHAGLRFLSDRWGWSVEKTQRYINKHIKKHEIERRTEHGESIISLCNYEYYNPMEGTLPNTTSDTMSDTTPYTARTPTSTNNKKDKEVIYKKTLSRERVKKDFVPPSLSDMEEYFEQNGYTRDAAKKAYLYYTAGDWVDSKGNAVKNWKQKCIQVWFKPENQFFKMPL